MGFYISLEQVAPTRFREVQVPPIFWVLYFILGFALICMGASAFFILWDMASKGSLFDQVLVGFFAAMIPIYIVIGLKLAFLRKFLDLSSNELTLGYEFFGTKLFGKNLKKEDVAAIELINKRPSSNMAPREHSDSQYYIRGHWRVSIKLKSGRALLVDKHTEKEALEGIHTSLNNWLGS